MIFIYAAQYDSGIINVVTRRSFLILQLSSTFKYSYRYVTEESPAMSLTLSRRCSDYPGSAMLNVLKRISDSLSAMFHYRKH